MYFLFWYCTNSIYPTGNLDSRTGEKIMDLLGTINRDSGQTSIVVTHSLEAAKSDSRVITVKDGMIVWTELEK